MKPLLRLTDPTFAYTPSWQTNIRERFAKVRAEIAAEQARERAGIVERVTPLKRETRK